MIAGRRFYQKDNGAFRRFAAGTLYIFWCFIAVAAGGEGKKPPLTILDTLNNGRELRFGAPDSAAAGMLQTSTAQTRFENRSDAPMSETMEYRREAGVVPSRFVIQVLAATSQQQVQQEKRSVAAKTKLPVSVEFDAPYYKLYVGDCPDRTEAENVLAQVKKLGYNDAWIVRVSATRR